MRTIISNNIEVINYSSELYDWCEKNLIVINPVWEQLMKRGDENTIRRKHVPKDLKLYVKKPDKLIIPFGCLWGIWDYIKDSPYTTKFNEVNDLSIKYTPCPWKLRDYQEDAIQQVLLNKGGILSAGCGAGKTISGIEMIHRIGKKALWIVHTKDLLKQANKNMKELYPNLEIGYITDGKVDIGKDITISTVQTLDKISPIIYAEEFGTVVVDECFPAGTKISTRYGLKNIEDIKVGDEVLSFNHQKNEVEYKKVKHLFVKTSNNLNTLKINDNIITATPNHPFYTQRGYVRMEELNDGDYVLQELPESNYERRYNKSKMDPRKIKRIHLLQSRMCNCLQKETGLVRRIKKEDVRENDNSKQNASSFPKESRKNEEQQSYVSRRSYTKNDGNERKKWYSPQSNKKSWWEWENNYLPRNFESRINEHGLSTTIRISSENKQDERTKKLLSNLLQDRYSNTTLNGSNRSRWRNPLWKKGKNARRKKDKILEWKRVESVESYEHSNSTRCESGYQVFNFEVENNNNYFANGILVHNCHHVSGSPTYSKMFQRVIDNIPARWKIGLSATVFRNDSLSKTMFTTLGMNKNKEFAPAYEVTRDRINVLTATHIGIDVDTEFSYSTLNEDGTIDYNSLIDYLSNNEYRNEVIIDNVLKCNEEGRKQALLCLRVSHCESLYKMLKDKGLRVELITGKSNAKKREEALNQTDNWDVIISTVSLFKEGIDIKALDSVHLCSPVKDKSAVVQACGRCERILEGKKEPKFFDYVDTKFPYCKSAYKKRVSYLKNRN